MNLETLKQRVRVNEVTGCWMWTGQRAHGYGTIYYDRRTWFTHRLSYVLTHGSIADDLQIDHLCENPRCCRPEHLEAVTPAENLRRTRRIDDAKAQEFFDAGKSIRDVAEYFDVSTQAVYLAITAGRLNPEAIS